MDVYTIVYDGECNVCRRIVRALSAWDGGTLEIVPSQTAGLHARFAWITAEAYRESLQVIGPNGQTWQGAAAVEQILTVLPRGRLVAWIFHIPFVRGLAEKAYRWIARNRYRLGCSEHCRP